MKDLTKSAALFVAGTLFGSLGFKLLGSKDAQNLYVHATAAGLRVKEQALNKATEIQESAADILAAAKELNEERAAKEAAKEEAAEIADEAEEISDAASDEE